MECEKREEKQNACNLNQFKCILKSLEYYFNNSTTYSRKKSNAIMAVVYDERIVYVILS
jgi:hypothetical protein